MRAVLFSFPGWLCLFCASARSAPASSSTTPANRAHISTASHGSAKTEEMASASTALDFRELMRKERERAMKERMTAAAPSASASRTRCFAVDRSHATMLSELCSSSHSLATRVACLPLAAPEDDRAAVIHTVCFEAHRCVTPGHVDRSSVCELGPANKPPSPCCPSTALLSRRCRSCATVASEHALGLGEDTPRPGRRQQE